MSISKKQVEDLLFGLTFQFQPIIGADGSRVLAYEMLARRSLPDGTIQGPSAFIAAVMQPDRIEAFTLHSLDFAVARLRANPDIPALSVNLSPRQIELGVTTSFLARSSPSVRRRLIVELTEDPITDHPALPAALAAVATLGVRIFLDDVAPDWQQRCAALQDAVHGIKLDRSLLADFTADRLEPSARALLELTRQKRLLVVAEGIEDVDVLPTLAARGVPYFQGFALGEPWSEPRVGRRRIVQPRIPVVLAEQELLGLSAPITYPKGN